MNKIKIIFGFITILFGTNLFAGKQEALALLTPELIQAVTQKTTEVGAELDELIKYFDEAEKHDDDAYWDTKKVRMLGLKIARVKTTLSLP